MNSELLLGRSYLDNLIHALVGRNLEFILFGNRWGHKPTANGQPTGSKQGSTRIKLEVRTVRRQSADR